jgi:hypothetical protein
MESKGTVNQGDRVDGTETPAEKKQMIAVDSIDITGEHVVVPTYISVEDESGEEKLLHHLKDAEEISDVIRQVRVDENGDRRW